MSCHGAEETKLKLYSYFMSSCSCRVRIALNLKGLEYEYIPVTGTLLKGPEFTKLNPMGYVPVLVDGDIVVSDSSAIIMYLEEKYPQKSLLPSDLQKKAINYQSTIQLLRSMISAKAQLSCTTFNVFGCNPQIDTPAPELQAANIVSSSIQPHQNTGVLKYIEEKVGHDEKLEWPKRHIRKGFAALEKLLKDYAGKYATGDEVYLADLFLAPQIHAAFKRFNLDMSDYPLLTKLHEAYSELPAFQAAMPENQPDTPSTS